MQNSKENLFELCFNGYISIKLLNVEFRYRTCFEQGAPEHSGNYVECRFTLKCIRAMI